jgi:hypothetical protein
LPGNKDAAGVVFITLDDKLITAEIRSAEPGQVVAATHVHVVKTAGWNPFPIVDDESHQAHVGSILQ